MITIATRSISRRVRAALVLSCFTLTIASGPMASATPPFPCPEPQWVRGQGAPGSGPVYATTMWDPDGAGPAAPTLVVGGDLGKFCGTPVNEIALFDPATGAISTLGLGIQGTVRALAVLKSGELIAAGEIYSAGGPNWPKGHHIARWQGPTEGGQWTTLGGGVSYVTHALVALKNGDLVAGGEFTAAGGFPANHIARWNHATQSWSPLGEGVNSWVLTLAEMPDGDIVAGGYFTEAGGAKANHIARWNEASQTWSTLGDDGGGVGVGGFTSVSSLLAMPDGNLYVGGTFLTAGDVTTNSVARWNGTTQTWSALGAGVSNAWFPVVRALALLPGGEIAVGGNFDSAGGLANEGLARWDPSTGVWSSLGGMMNIHYEDTGVSTITVVPGGDLVVGGDFPGAGDVQSSSIVRWKIAEQAWFPLNDGPNDIARALLVVGDDDVIVGGRFSHAGGSRVNRIARWAPSTQTWTDLGGGVSGPAMAPWAEVRVLVARPGGVLAGGRFLQAGGVSASNIAQWNGSAWSPLGAGVNEPVNALLSMPNGDLIAGGEFTIAGGQPANFIARWIDTAGTWSPLGEGLDDHVLALAVLTTGELVAGGTFSSAGGVKAYCVARWDDASNTWSSFDTTMSALIPNPAINAILALPDGNLIAAGSFALNKSFAKNIAHWDTSTATWTKLGAGVNQQIYALAALANGDVIATGSFSSAGGMPAARWDVAVGQWSPVGTGAIDRGLALSVSPSGELLVGGSLYEAGGKPSAYVARYTCTDTPPCPADCDGSGTLDIIDLICFQQDFYQGSTSADCDASGGLSIEDFTCFQTLFAIGC